MQMLQKIHPFVLFMEIGKAILVGLMNHRVLAGLTTFCWPTCFVLTPLSQFLIRSPLGLLYEPNHLVHLPFMLFQWHQSFIEVILLLVNDLFWLAKDLFAGQSPTIVDNILEKTSDISPFVYIFCWPSVFFYMQNHPQDSSLWQHPWYCQHQPQFRPQSIPKFPFLLLKKSIFLIQCPTFPKLVVKIIIFADKIIFTGEIPVFADKTW